MRRLIKKTFNKYADDIQDIEIRTHKYGFTIKVGCATLVIDNFQELMDTLAFYILHPDKAEKELIYGRNEETEIRHRVANIAQRVVGAGPLDLPRRPILRACSDLTPACTKCGSEDLVNGGMHITPEGAQPLCNKCFNKLRKDESQTLKGDPKK